jgi:hypothetical protein
VSRSFGEGTPINMIIVNPLPVTHHHFPALDFMFKTTGHSTAILHKFCIVIEDIKVDPRPFLSGSIGVVESNQPHVIFTSEGAALCA